MQITFKLYAGLTDYLPLVRHMHLKDFNGGTAFLGYSPLGQGKVDIPAILDLAAKALTDTIARKGNRAIFGGAYGWSSAGRFHHAQSQVLRES